MLELNVLQSHVCRKVTWKWKWSRSVVSDSATRWTVAHQATPSMGLKQHGDEKRRAGWVGSVLDKTSQEFCPFQREGGFDLGTVCQLWAGWSSVDALCVKCSVAPHCYQDPAQSPYPGRWRLNPPPSLYFLLTSSHRALVSAPDNAWYSNAHCAFYQEFPQPPASSANTYSSYKACSDVTSAMKPSWVRPED